MEYRNKINTGTIPAELYPLIGAHSGSPKLIHNNLKTANLYGSMDTMMIDEILGYFHPLNAISR